MTALVVEVLHTEACGSWRPAVGRVQELAESEGIAVELLVAVVETLEQARERRFPGSPTVRVEGRDVEPGAELLEDFGLG